MYRKIVMLWIQIINNLVFILGHDKITSIARYDQISILRTKIVFLVNF